MRKFLTLAAVLVAFAGLRADEKIAAPVPKAPAPPAIDGKYTLLVTTGGAPTGKGGFAKADPTDTVGGFGGRATVRSEVIITKNEITIEPRTVTATPIIMEYTIDPTKSPITIDAEMINVRGKRTKMPGIVEINNNRITIALAKEGTERPKTTDEAEGVVVYYLLKAPPAPKVEFKIVAMRVGDEEAAEKELNKLAAAGYELVNTTNPAATNDKSAPTTVHFILKRTVK
jgi:uncharacterized protein (TIGR03067 family)